MPGNDLTVTGLFADSETMPDYEDEYCTITPTGPVSLDQIECSQQVTTQSGSGTDYYSFTPPSSGSFTITLRDVNDPGIDMYFYKSDEMIDVDVLTPTVVTKDQELTGVYHVQLPAFIDQLNLTSIDFFVTSSG